VAGPRVWNNFPKISAIPAFQLALAILANITKCYCFLLHEASAHTRQFDFYAPFINALTYLLTPIIFFYRNSPTSSEFADLVADLPRIWQLIKLA